MGGAGGASLERAYHLGCDTYLTSDIKYDQFLTARELGINLIDGDHFCTENPIIYALHEDSTSRFPASSCGYRKGTIRRRSSLDMPS